MSGRLLRLRIVFVPLVLAAAAAHAGKPPAPLVPSPNSERGTIGIIVRSKAPVRFIRATAAQVFFVQIEEGVDPLAADFVVPSNYVRGGQIFLLNAKPGRYVAVAAVSPGAPGWESKMFFSREMIPLTEVRVTPGEVTFAGEYMVLQDLAVAKADPAQAHYVQMIAGSDASKNEFLRSLNGRGLYLATLGSAAKEPADEREFWEKAKEGVFRGQAKWLRLVDKRLAALPEKAK